MTSSRSDILVVGAGPAGLAAAVTAAETGCQVTLVDDNPHVGGQVWRAERETLPPRAAQWYARARQAKVHMVGGATVVYAPSPHELFAHSVDGAKKFQCEKLILATGAHERFLPFPGWTLPGVVGVGGLQALVKGGLPVVGKRVALVGTGPLLLAVGAFLMQRGAHVLCIAEQARRTRVLAFGASLAWHPRKLREAVKLKRATRPIPRQYSTWPLAIRARSQSLEIDLTRKPESAAAVTKTLECDLIGCGFGVVPDTVLARALGCDLNGEAVRVNDHQQTSIANVYCAGESNGIGGADLALVEGEVAALRACGQTIGRDLQKRLDRGRSFAQGLNDTYQLRDELRHLGQEDTIVCRCEDVPLEHLHPYGSFRDAKLKTRCGMGACQGRVCGGALAFLRGWAPDSVRPPYAPIPMEDFARMCADATT